MNIFWLDKDPKLSAEYACDQHIVNQITEYGQLLHSALYSLGFDDLQMRRISNMNHPCAVWVRTDFANFVYLCRLTEEYYRQYKVRYGNKQHLSFLKMQVTLQSIGIRAIRPGIPITGSGLLFLGARARTEDRPVAVRNRAPAMYQARVHQAAYRPCAGALASGGPVL